ncbi:MAG: hypothetical protein J5I93_13185 [Pirellulaceae bacterium]|nr:hypothetical protein [Pirellulaceae bacterium]
MKFRAMSSRGFREQEDPNPNAKRNAGVERMSPPQKREKKMEAIQLSMPSQAARST